MSTYDSRPDTLAHIRRVQTLLAEMQANLAARAIAHDTSKLESPEVEVFDKETPTLRDLTYGSDDYKAALARLGEGLAHHYASNSHHPEHYENGISGMSLLDVVEMLADWAAAVERHEDGNITTSINQNAERFGYDELLTSIFHNTIRELEWESTRS